MKKIFLLLIVIAVLITSSACKDSMVNAPDINILHNGSSLSYEVGLDSWNGAVYDRIDNFDYLFNYTDKEIREAEDKNSFKISFYGDFPDKYKLSYEFLDKSGKMIDGTSPAEIRVKTINDVIVYDFEDHVTANYRQIYKGELYLGFRLICSWGDDSCEYSYALKLADARGDSDTEAETGDNSPTEFSYTSYRTKYLGDADLNAPYAELFANYSDLRSYCQENKAKFDLNYEGGAFADLMSVYDDNFFKEKLLIAVIAEEKSESFKLDVSSVESRNGHFYITVTRSGSYTSVKPADWHIVVELSKNDYSGEPISVILINNADESEKESVFTDDLYLLTDDPYTDLGYENAFAFYPDGTYKLSVNNYNGFYAMHGRYTVEGARISMYEGENTENESYALEYSEESNCYIFLSDAGCGTMFDKTKVYISDTETYNTVIGFHSKWNEEASWE